MLAVQVGLAKGLPKILNYLGTWLVGGANTYQWFLPILATGPHQIQHDACVNSNKVTKTTFWLGNLAMINWNNIVSDIVVGVNNM